MGKFLQKYGILFFFCAMMGGIIMVDSIFAIAFTDKERGLATEFSDYTMKISILQADSQEAFRQKEFLLFLQEKAQIETINVLKQIAKMESCFIQMSLNQCKVTHLSKRQIPQ